MPNGTYLEKDMGGNAGNGDVVLLEKTMGDMCNLY